MQILPDILCTFRYHISHAARFVSRLVSVRIFGDERIRREIIEFVAPTRPVAVFGTGGHDSHSVVRHPMVDCHDASDDLRSDVRTTAPPA